MGVVVEGKQTIQDHCDKAFCDAWGGEGGANRRLTQDNHDAPEKTFELGCFIIPENAKYSTVTIEATAEVCIPASATIGKVVVEGKQTIQDHCDKAFCDAWGGEGGANRRLTEDNGGSDEADDDDGEESSESTVTSEQTYQAGCFIMPENAKFTTVIIESAAKVCIPASATIGKVVVHGKQTIQDHCDAAFCEESDGEDGSD